MLEGCRGKMRDKAKVVKTFSCGLRQHVDCTAISNVTGQYIAPIFSVKDEAAYSFHMVLIICQITDVISHCSVLRGREHKVV